MRDLFQLAWDVLLFRHEAYTQHVARADVLRRGLALLVLVTLVAGTLSLIIGLVHDLRPMSIEARHREVEQGIQEFTRPLDTMRQYFDLPLGFEEEMLAYMRPGIEIGFRITTLPTPLPRPVGDVLADLGAFLSLPFSRMGGWIGYAIWVLLVAKLLGGRATVSQMLGATALYAVPHILDILSPVRCVGEILGLVATVWGIAIYVKALAIANDFSIERAIVATVVPALVGGALVLLSLMTLLILVLAIG